MEFIILLFVVGLLTLVVMPIVAVVQVAKLRGELAKLRNEQTRLENEVERLNRQRNRAFRGRAELDDAINPAIETEPAESTDFRESTESIESIESIESAKSTKSPADEGVVDAVLVVRQRETAVAPAAGLSSLPVPYVAERLAETAKPSLISAERPAQPARASRGSAISLEERLGAKLPVWLGAIALMLAGVFLVAFAVKRGWFTPRMRVYASAALGTSLIVAGLGLRRRYSDIAQGLAAAGVGILYAVVLAVATIFHAEFPFVGSLASLYMIVGITALAIALSLYLGPLVALIGLLGGFATPALIGVGSEHATPLFLGLIAQQVGTSIIGRRNAQWGFALIALVAVELYVAAWMLVHWDPLQAPLLGGVVLAALVCFAATLPVGLEELSESRWGKQAAWRWAVWLLPAVPAILLSSILVARSEMSFINIALHAAQLVGLMIFARVRGEFVPLFPVAAGITVATVLLRVGVSNVAPERLAEVIAGGQIATMLFGGILGWGSLLASRGGRMTWAWSLTGAAALAVLGAAPHVAAEASLPTVRWLAVGGALIGLAAAAAGVAQSWRRVAREFDWVTTTFLWSLAALILLAVLYWIELQQTTHYWFAVAAGGTTVLSAALVRWWRLPMATWLVVSLGVVVLLGLLNLDTLREPLESHLVWHRASLGFGAGILSLLVAGRLLSGPDLKQDPANESPLALSSWFYAASAALTAVYLCLLVRHGFHRWTEPSPRSEWLEIATDLIALAAVGLALGAIARGMRDSLLRRVAQWMGGIAIAGTLACTCWAFGPLVRPIAVGEWPLVNWLAYAIGIPVMLVGLLLWFDWTPGDSHEHSAKSSAAARGDLHWGDALWLLWGLAAVAFLLVETRHAFWRTGTDLALREMESIHICELPVYATILGVLCGFAAWRTDRTSSIAWRTATIGCCLAFGLAGLAIVLGMNPLLMPRDVGGMPVFNLLWVILALPAVVAAALALQFRWDAENLASRSVDANQEWRRSLRAFRWIASVLSLLLVWLFVTAEVRQYFVGSILPGPPPGQNEWYAYSAAWMVLAIGLLSIGVATRASAMRWASLILMLLSVCKVFLFDTRQLGDLWRVASYLGLGVSLMLVAFVYQRFVFRDVRGRPGDLP